jgi:hypothetical protein
VADDLLSNDHPQKAARKSFAFQIVPGAFVRVLQRQNGMLVHLISRGERSGKLMRRKLRKNHLGTKKTALILVETG